MKSEHGQRRESEERNVAHRYQPECSAYPHHHQARQGWAPALQDETPKDDQQRNQERFGPRLVKIWGDELRGVVSQERLSKEPE